MNAERYIKEILKKVRVNHKTKRRLREDLSEAVAARLAAGLSLKQVIQEMGEPTAVAAEIQEAYPVRRRTKPEACLLVGSIASLGYSALLGLGLGLNLLQTLVLRLMYPTLAIPSMPGSTAASVGIIGGADGPTAVFVTSRVSPFLLPLLLGLALTAAYLLLRRREKK